jgi:Spy/CpxP family protein refolding chaperone
MKKILFLLPGAIAVILAAAPIVAVNAQNSAPTAPTGERMQNKNRLNLSADQQTRMKAIRETTRTQIDGVLTDAQRTQLQSQKGQGRGKGWKSLNLSDDQKARIKTIMEASRRDREAVLTPAQLEQMRQFKSQRRANRPAR